MTIVSIVSQKGGAGKTTLALHLATSAEYANKPACIVDTDPQATAAAWADWRGDFLPEVITSPPMRIATTVSAVIRRGVELIVIDTPPNAETAAREAVRVADLILIPARPRAFDLHALQATAEFLKFARKPAFVFFNAVPPRAVRVLAEAKEFAEGLGLATCPVFFCERVAFHRYASAGSVAAEAEPNGKAAVEVSALWHWVCDQAGIVEYP